MQNHLIQLARREGFEKSARQSDAGTLQPEHGRARQLVADHRFGPAAFLFRLEPERKAGLNVDRKRNTTVAKGEQRAQARQQAHEANEPTDIQMPTIVLMSASGADGT